MANPDKQYLKIAIVFVVCASFFAGCGRKLDNADIVSAIRSKMKDAKLNDCYVHVESRNGTVTLTGTVPSASAGQEIDALARTAGGKARFADKMAVVMPVSGSPASTDATIEDSLEKAFSSHGLQGIEVTSKAGVVTLNGDVADLGQEARAERLARETDGVQKVIDQLQMRSAESSLPVKARPARTVLSLKATPSLITPGKTAVLSWTSHNAKSLDLEPGIGGVGPEGSRTVNPQASTTYTLTAVGQAGRATATAQVNVWNAVPPPTISASVNPVRIQKGQSARLTWASQDAGSVDIEPGIGRVVPSGSTTLAPAQTTQYTLTATGQGGTETATALVTVAAGAESLTIPAGTDIPVTMIDSINSGVNRVGQTFAASVTSAVVVGERVVIPQGANARVGVEEARRAGHFKGKSLLKVDLVSVTVNGVVHNVQTSSYKKQGAARGKNSAETIAGAGGIGALIGGILGGGKGAAIGGAIGGGAGTAKQAATHGQQASIPSETRLDFALRSPVTVKLPASNR